MEIGLQQSVYENERRATTEMQFIVYHLVVELLLAMLVFFVF